MSWRKSLNGLVRTCTSLMEAITIEISYQKQLCSNKSILIMDVILSETEIIIKLNNKGFSLLSTVKNNAEIVCNS